MIETYIDHTLLAANATEDKIDTLCREAIDYNFYSVCVNGYYVPKVVENLKGTEVKTTAVVGFPLGAMTPKAKAWEAKEAVENGADEIDMVINIGALLDGNDELVLEDIQKVREATTGAVLKVIIETCLLNDEQKVRACKLAVQAAADYVKTSTGFSTGGATEHDVRLMAQTVGEACKVKASGAIRTLASAKAMIAAGASRIGASGGVAFVEEERAEN